MSESFIWTLHAAHWAAENWYVCSQNCVNKTPGHRELIHKLFNGSRSSRGARQPVRLGRSFLAVGQIFSPRIFKRNAADKKCAGSTADSICAGAGNHASDDVAPARKKLQDCPCTFAQKHSHADVCSKRRDKLRRSAQASFAAADVHDSRDHYHLERSKNRHVRERNGLRSDSRANCGRRFYQHLCDVMLRVAIA